DVANSGNFYIEILLCEEVVESIVARISLIGFFHFLQPIRCGETQRTAELFTPDAEADDAQSDGISAHWACRWRGRGFYIQCFQQEVLFLFCTTGDLRPGEPDSSNERNAAEPFE